MWRTGWDNWAQSRPASATKAMKPGQLRAGPYGATIRACRITPFR